MKQVRKNERDVLRGKEENGNEVHVKDGVDFIKMSCCCVYLEAKHPSYV